MDYVQLVDKGLSCNYTELNDCEILNKEIYRKNQNISYYVLIMYDIT